MDGFENKEKKPQGLKRMKNERQFPIYNNSYPHLKL